jgi:predicted CopG family antitoxin
MLFESDVISSVCNYLKKYNFDILQQLDENQKGDDIIAINNKGQKIYIEAKGETSSKESSNRFGKEFNGSQKKVHVSQALYRAIKMKEENNSLSGIAFPETKGHLSLIEPIRQTLQKIGIEVFWVKDDGTVRVENNSKIF